MFWPVTTLAIRLTLCLLLIIAWAVVGHISQRATAAAAASSSETDSTGSSGPSFSFLPWCSALFAFLLVVVLFYIRRASAAVYLPLRRQRLARIPRLQRQLDPRWTDGETMLYGPRGFRNLVERWLLGLRAEVVLPVARMPSCPGYDGAVAQGLDQGTVEFMTQRAVARGIAPQCEHTTALRII